VLELVGGIVDQPQVADGQVGQVGAQAGVRIDDQGCGLGVGPVIEWGALAPAAFEEELYPSVFATGLAVQFGQPAPGGLQRFDPPGQTCRSESEGVDLQPGVVAVVGLAFQESLPAAGVCFELGLLLLKTALGLFEFGQ